MSDVATVEEDAIAHTTTPLREWYLADSSRLSLLPQILLRFLFAIGSRLCRCRLVMSLVYSCRSLSSPNYLTAARQR